MGKEERRIVEEGEGRRVDGVRGRRENGLGMMGKGAWVVLIAEVVMKRRRNMEAVYLCGGVRAFTSSRKKGKQKK